ncbi:MAG: aldose 1-epimerase [Ferruginibacter sp.]
MFATETVTAEGFEKIILRDNISKTFVEILPACGGILHGFNVVHDGQWLNVIDHYDDPIDFKNNVASGGFKSCKLSPFACRINNAHYRFGEKEYTIDKFLLGTSALHGLLYDAPFTITNQSANDACATVSLDYKYRGDDKGYPFLYDCLVHYTLGKENLLNIRTEIINRDKGLIPIQDGWHPYFNLGDKIDDMQLEFQAKEILVSDDRLIPTGALLPYHEFDALKKIGSTSFDDCFTLSFAECQPLCVLRSPVKKIQCEIYPGKEYPYLQIYTPEHRNSIAFENLSAAPDAFNNKMGLIILEPEEKMIFATSYKLTSLI